MLGYPGISSDNLGYPRISKGVVTTTAAVLIMLDRALPDQLGRVRQFCGGGGGSQEQECDLYRNVSRQH